MTNCNALTKVNHVSCLQSVCFQTADNDTFKHYQQSLMMLSSAELTDLWLAPSFAFDLFKGFDGFLALWALFLLIWDGRLVVHFHSAPPLLGQQLWMDPRQNPSVRYSHSSQKLMDKAFFYINLLLSYKTHWRNVAGQLWLTGSHSHKLSFLIAFSLSTSINRFAFNNELLLNSGSLP